MRKKLQRKGGDYQEKKGKSSDSGSENQEPEDKKFRQIFGREGGKYGRYARLSTTSAGKKP